MALNFNDALMEARRRGQLQGRPLTANEVSGISEGYASSASDRLARAKTIGLQERQISNQEGQFAQTFAENQRVTNEQLRRADEARSDAKQQQLISNVGSGAVLAYQIPAVKSLVNAGASKLFSGLFEGGAAAGAGAGAGALAGMEGLTMDLGGLATESLMTGGSAAGGSAAGTGALGTIGTVALPFLIAYGLMSMKKPSVSPIPEYAQILQSGRIPNVQTDNAAVQYKGFLENMFREPDPNMGREGGVGAPAGAGPLMPGAEELINDFMADPFKYLNAGGTLEDPFSTYTGSMVDVRGNYQAKMNEGRPMYGGEPLPYYLNKDAWLPGEPGE